MKCIFCLEVAPLSVEHIIPEALGGVLTCAFLCRDCNSKMGSTAEAAARSDPSVRIAVENLAPQIPSIAARLREGQTFYVNRPDEKDPGKIKDGMFQVRSRKLRDESLIQPTPIARQSIESILRKAGAGDAPIAEAKRRLDEAPEDQRVEIVPGLEVIKWGINKVHLDLNNSKLMSPLVPLKIAFEFLALHLSSGIYDDAIRLRKLRQVLVGNDVDHSTFQVERLNAAKYESFHGICFEGNEPHAKVLIRLFGWLAFRVHFFGLAVSGDRFLYTHRLDSGRETVQVRPRASADEEPSDSQT